MKPLTIRHMVLCESSAIDVDPGRRVSLFNLIEDAQVIAFPAIFPKLTAFAIVERSDTLLPESLDASLSIMRPEGRGELLRHALTFDPGNRRIRVRFVLDGFPVMSPGTYVFALSVTDRDGGVAEAGATLDVTEVQPKATA